MNMCSSSLLTTSDQSPRCSLAVKFLPGVFKVLKFSSGTMKIYAYLNNKSCWLVCLLLVVARPPWASALEYLVLIILVSFLLQRQSTMTKRNLGKERVYLVLHSHITVHHPGKPRQELKAGIWKQELKQRPQKNAACWFDPKLMFSYFLMQSRPTCLGMALPTMHWAFTHLSLV